MRRVLLIVFTGTRHTLEVAELLRKAFAARGTKADILDSTRYPRFLTGRGSPRLEARLPEPFRLEDYDTLGLGYPIYAFNPPLIFIRLVRRLKLSGKGFFIFKNSGEPLPFNDPSSAPLFKYLRNCTFLGEYHFLMPYNIHFRYPDNLVKEMYAHVRRYSEGAVENLLEGRMVRIKYRLLYRFIALLFRIQWIGGPVNSLLYRVDRGRCTKCLRCVRNCPAENITQREGRILFGRRCQMCMRCSFYCPVNAVFIGFLERWKVNGPYPFAAIMADKGLDGKFLEKTENWFFRLFIPYYQRLNHLLEKRETLKPHRSPAKGAAPRRGRVFTAP